MPSLFVSGRWNYKWLPWLREILATFYFSDLGQRQVFPSHHKMSLELTGKAPSGSSHGQNMASIWWTRLRFENVNSNVRQSHKKHLIVGKERVLWCKDKRDFHRGGLRCWVWNTRLIWSSKCFRHIIKKMTFTLCSFLSVTCWRQDLIPVTIDLADCCGKKKCWQN